MKNYQYIAFSLLIIIIAITSCSVEKFIPDDERLYTGAEIEIKSDSVIKNESQLKTVLEEALQPKPNKKFLGSYYGLYYHYKAQKEKPGFINRFLNKKLGEAPVYQSDVKPYDVEDILINRLENRGFFYSTATSRFVEDTTSHKASAIYTLRVVNPYTIATYQVDSMPQPLYSQIKRSVDTSYLKPGLRFDLSNMKQERERIDSDLKNKGYYNFNSNFLIFEADTNQYDRKKFDLFLTLKKEVPTKSVIPYKLSKINIYPNYDLQKDSLQTDTVNFNNKNFIQEEEIFFKPKYLDPFVTLEKGQYYSPEYSRNTARRLSTIGAYKFVNIQYKEVDSSATDSLGLLEANIYLSPLNKRAIRAELQAVTKSNNFSGPHFGLTFSNRNLFKGGETLNISANVGYEFQAGGGGNAGKTSIDLGVKGELIFPRVIFPVKINNNFFKYSIPKTKTSLGVNYLSRSKLYTLLSGTAQFGYIWDANKYVTHEIIPISINYTQLSNTTKEFDSILMNNPFLRRSFEQQFISGLIYSFTYNGMVDTYKKHTFYLNSTLDVAGNSISLFGTDKDGNGIKDFLGLEYAQYAKADVDLHYHFKLGKEQLIAARLFGGYGLAFGNSDVIPFVKQYYSGGPYSVRAFRIRSLGPGTYNSETDGNGTTFDQTGNIRLEANLEYRFPLFSYLKGAVFADAGNIWNSKENPSQPGGKFTSKFINELGMGAGIGLRVDVQGFVIRFDLAAPFQDPSKPKGQRFDFNISKPVLNFAIGYPF